MRRYAGPEPDLFGAGSDSTKGYDWEAYNFSPFGGQVYGYCSASRQRTINVDRLGGNQTAAHGVTVAWIAPHPSGGQCVVGWYRNATVFRELQPSPEGRHCLGSDGSPVQFNLTAAATDAVLLEPDTRSFEVPRARGFMGQANVSYLEAPEAEPMRERLLEYIGSFTPFRAGYADEVPQGAYIEGATVQVTSNAFDRDRRARAACLAHFGYSCVVCGTAMGNVYGELAERLIHVHHLTEVVNECETQNRII